MKIFLSLLSFVFLWNVQLMAQPKSSFKGFVEIETGRSLFVDYTAPREGQPTLIVLNGLTYSTWNNETFVLPLKKQGVGILLFDPIGMGRTLLRYAPVKAVIPFMDQVRDLKLLLDVLEFKGPQTFAGLSYGGGLGIAFASQYPNMVKNVVMMAPFTQPLEGQDKMVKDYIAASRSLWPFNQMSEEELYTYFFRNVVYSTYPLSEPIVLENPFKLEAVMHMALGGRYFNAKSLAHLVPKKSLHLVVARQDQYIPVETLDSFWNAVPESAKASRLYVNGSEHKLVEAVPRFMASWVYKVLQGDKNLYKNIDFEGYPFLNKITRDGNILFKGDDLP